MTTATKEDKPNLNVTGGPSMSPSSFPRVLPYLKQRGKFLSRCCKWLWSTNATLLLAGIVAGFVIGYGAMYIAHVVLAPPAKETRITIDGNEIRIKEDGTRKPPRKNQYVLDEHTGRYVRNEGTGDL